MPTPALPAGILPFWFWNTDMDEARIRRQLHALAEGGCVGAFIHPRQGYPGAYLSARWRERVALACRIGDDLGLAIGICDEFPYPSGNAGGLPALGHPEWWAQDLHQVQRDADGGPVAWDLPAGAVLACTAYPQEGGRVEWERGLDLRPAVGVAFRQETARETARDLSAYNGRRYFACDPAPRLEMDLPPGRWLLWASVQVPAVQRKYVGSALDTLDPAAMGAVLAATLPGYEGMPLRALFVDEIEPAAWSRHLPGWYQEATGEALAPLLPALVRDDHPRAQAVRRTLADLRHQRFATAFIDPLRAWCRRHQVVLGEERPLERLDACGADLPGCDPGHTRLGAPRHDLLGTDLRRNARAAAAAARGGPALCECGHSLGWGGTLEDLRLIMDGLLLHGVTHLIPHAAFASTAALRKHDAPPSFFIQQPWWPLHRHLADRVGRILAAVAGTRQRPELLVPPGTPEDLQHRLMAGGWEWTFADDAAMPDPQALPAPREAPWCPSPLVHRTIREGADGSVALLVSYDRTPAVVRLPPGWAPVDLDGAPPAGDGAGGWVLEPGQALLATTRPAPSPDPLPVVAAPWPTGWQVEPAAGNLLRLGTWTLAIEGRAITTGVYPLSEQIRHGGLAIAPAVDPGFGTPVRLGVGRQVCSYVTGFSVQAPMAATLLLEPDTLVDREWAIRLDDGPWWGADAFTPMPGLLPDEALGLAIPGGLSPGPHRLEIRVTAERPDGGLRNPVYLHGDWGIFAAGVLAPRPAQVPWGRLDLAGLPTAAGTLTWSAPVDLPTSGPGDQAGRVALALPELQVDAYEVALDDGPWIPVLWSPRRAIVPAWGPAGAHRLRVRQHLPPGRCFHGEGWDAQGHRTVPVALAPAP